MTDIDYSGPLRQDPSAAFEPPAEWSPPNIDSTRPFWWPFAVVAIGLVLVGFFAGRASAAELPAERPWIVWNEARTSHGSRKGPDCRQQRPGRPRAVWRCMRCRRRVRRERG